MTNAIPTKAELVDMIASRLESMKEVLSGNFNKSIDEVGVRYCTCDSLLPLEIAKQIYEAFPSVEKMRLMNSFRERKYTSKDFDRFDPLLAAITFAIQDPKVISIVEEITGIKDQIGDEQLYAGGLSVMSYGHFLGPHIDNSHDGQRIYYRTLNLLYYVSPDWSSECGGNLELWDKYVKHHTTIVSSFNRLAIMETNPKSWHSVSEVRVSRLRCCVSNYYFSPNSPIDREYFNVTSFSARPDQMFLRALTWGDNKLRQVLRAIAPLGAGKKDVFRGGASK